jgi:hypothetical protein
MTSDLDCHHDSVSKYEILYINAVYISLFSSHLLITFLVSPIDSSFCLVIFSLTLLSFNRMSNVRFAFFLIAFFNAMKSSIVGSTVSYDNIHFTCRIKLIFAFISERIYRIFFKDKTTNAHISDEYISGRVEIPVRIADIFFLIDIADTIKEIFEKCSTVTYRVGFRVVVSR